MAQDEVNCERRASLNVVLGSQWGDEGKGKLVDLLAQDADAVCRTQGGNNAGHTVIVGDKKYDFHMLPSGIVNEKALSIIGNGCVVHLPNLFSEIDKNIAKGLVGWEQRLKISDRAQMVFDMHQHVDALQESSRGSKSIGTTKKGIGPSYSTKATRNGIRICDLVGDFALFEERFRLLGAYFKNAYPDLVLDVEAELELYKDLAEKVRPLVCDTVSLVHKLLADPSKTLVVEGANALMLDIDFGTYPNVTSCNCSTGAVCTGLGVPPSAVCGVFGVVKAYLSRVGTGPFPTELHGELDEKLRSLGHEYGVTTGRPRRCGWIDVPMLRYSALVNGYTALCLTKMDIMDTFPEVKIGVKYLLNGKELEGFPASNSVLSQVEVEYLSMPGWLQPITDCTSFEQLPLQARNYVQKLEELLQIPIRWIGVGAARSAMLVRQ